MIHVLIHYTMHHHNVHVYTYYCTNTYIHCTFTCTMNCPHPWIHPLPPLLSFIVMNNYWNNFISMHACASRKWYVKLLLSCYLSTSMAKPDGKKNQQASYMVEFKGAVSLSRISWNCPSPPSSFNFRPSNTLEGGCTLQYSMVHTCTYCTTTHMHTVVHRHIYNIYT